MSKTVELTGRHWLLQHERGRLVVVETSNPLGAQPPWFRTYAVLASWLDGTAPVSMYVTINTRPGPDAPGHEINMVYADPALRGARSRSTSVAVSVGRWMLAQGLFALHSADRTEAGDAWARAVGGQLPIQDQQGTAPASERSGAAGLQRLNEVVWPQDVLELLALPPQEEPKKP